MSSLKDPESSDGRPLLLRKRTPDRSDLKWCAQILEDGFETNPEWKVKLPSIWSELLGTNSISMVVIEDVGAAQRVAFGAGVMVSDHFLAEAHAKGTPYLGVDLLNRHCTGREQCILTPAQMRKVNHPESGVNFIVLHYSETVDGYAPAAIRKFRECAVRELFETQAGYYFKEVTFEFFGEQDLDFCLALGFDLRTNYRDFYLSSTLPTPPPYRHPFLVGLNREEATRTDKWGLLVPSLFNYSPPLFFFTKTEQQVLSLALINLKDPQIAGEMDNCTSSLRDHWRSIYRKIGDAQKNWPVRAKILDCSKATKQQRAYRGQVIRYLREHPEELRPVDKKFFIRRAAIA